MNVIVIIILLLGLLGVFFKENKIYNFFIIIFMFILYGFNSYNADYIMYENKYYFFKSLSNVNGTEILYKLSCYFGNKIGLNYQQFLIIIAGICIFLLYRFFKSNTKYKSACLGLYFIFPFFLDMVQIRQFLSICIVLNGLKFILKDDLLWKDYLKFSLFIIIASTFHTLSLIYIIFILLPFLNKQNDSFKIIVATVLIVMSLIFVNIEPFENILLKIIGSEKVTAYFIDGKYANKSLFMAILYSFIQILPLIILLICKRNCNKYKEQYENESISYLNKIITLNILMLICVVFYFYTAEFSRLYRILLPLDFCCMLNIFNNYKRKLDFASLLLLIIFVLFYFYFFIFVNDVYDKTIDATFNNNILIERNK